MNGRPIICALVTSLVVAACGGSDSDPEPTQVDTDAGTDSSIDAGTAVRTCSPGEKVPCYTGPAGTENVGICHGGTKTCAADGSGFGACQDEVVPKNESCLTLEDDDCDGKVNEDGEGCACVPGTVAPCYSGPANTAGIGACKAGTVTCLPDGTAYGTCVGEVTPTPEDCETPIDDDCDGVSPFCPADWAKRFGDVAGQFAWGLAVAPTGGVAITGEIEGSVDFGGGSLTSAGSSDVFLTRLDASGAHVWSKRFGSGSLQSGQSVAFDPTGNVVIAGYFQGSVTFGPTALTTSGGSDIFVAKFSATGDHLWSKKFGSAADDQLGLAVAVDAQGNVLLTGALTGSINFGGGSLATTGGPDVFVVKLNPAGNHVWSNSFGEAGTAQTGRAIATDATGNVLVAGDFTGTIDFGGGALASAGGTDAFVAKLDPSGGHVWSKSFGDDAFQIARGVAADATGNVVVVGDFAGSTNFGGAALASKGATDGFVALFDPSGAHLGSTNFGGAEYDSATSVSAAGGAIAVGGYVAGNASFGGTPLASAGGRDVFVAKLAGTTLAPLWARTFGDASSYQSTQGVGLDAQGNALFAGYFTGAIDFGLGPLTSAGGTDIFVAKVH